MIGSGVKYTDEHGITHDALVTRLWPRTDVPDENCMINLVYVVGDESKEDQYGRQIERKTSVAAKSTATAPGNFWEPRVRHVK